MAQGSGTLICPKGHTSSEADYCSECGAKIQGAGSAPAAISHGNGIAGLTDAVCPDCGTVREQSEVVFCEVCGYNFATGAHGEVPVAATPVVAAEAPPAPPAVPSAVEIPPAANPIQWTATISVDPGLRSPESPEAPAGLQPYRVSLDQPTTLIGRRNDARGIFPEIPLPHDEAVSRRHALLQMDPQRGLLLRDIGAANGTRLNGKDLEPMVDYPLHDGDEITLGHWTRIKVQAS